MVWILCGTFIILQIVVALFNLGLVRHGPDWLGLLVPGVLILNLYLTTWITVRYSRGDRVPWFKFLFSMFALLGLGLFPEIYIFIDGQIRLAAIRAEQRTNEEKTLPCLTDSDCGELHNACVSRRFGGTEKMPSSPHCECRKETFTGCFKKGNPWP